MNRLLSSTPHLADRADDQPRPDLAEMAYGACSALMPYVLVTLLLVAFG